MSKIRSTNTKPEVIVRKFLFRNGFRYRLHKKDLPGRPDIVLKKYKTSIFINGCFWHKHANCRYSSIPTSNVDYWSAKLNLNSEKDKIAVKELKKLDWNVIIIWECELKNEKSQITLAKLLKVLR